ncbi:MAG: (2Fe-2S)-binding protein [Bdellovibrionaceae bacterium]|nr:(2Fe-2S)-binding protein [Bdellovibrio sp.]
MNISVRSQYQSQIDFDGQTFKAVGPLSLLNRLQEMKRQFGVDPTKWSFNVPKTNDDFLIHELICAVQKKPALAYAHEELCHCRMVPAEKVHQALKQGCRTVNEIARTTLAGTGCGACRKDTEKILGELSTASSLLK